MIDGVDYVLLYARKGGVKDISSEIMTDLLMDTNVSTYRMFEDLCNRYVDSGNADFQEGIDFALRVLTNYDLHQIAEMVHEEAGDDDEEGADEY